MKICCKIVMTPLAFGGLPWEWMALVPQWWALLDGKIQKGAYMEVPILALLPGGCIGSHEKTASRNLHCIVVL